jgi:predicted MFS family arabinose efflux permease
MKRLVSVVAVVVFLSWSAVAQTSADDSPASKADVERYFQIVKSHDMLKKMMATMAQSMHQVMHEQYLKHQDELPADFESRMTARTDEM